jgi:hypothetical protein
MSRSRHAERFPASPERALSLRRMAVRCRGPDGPRHVLTLPAGRGPGGTPAMSTACPPAGGTVEVACRRSIVSFRDRGWGGGGLG